MNKAFVREADSDGRAYCPRCGARAWPGVMALLNLTLLNADADAKLNGDSIILFRDCGLDLLDR